MMVRACAIAALLVGLLAIPAPVRSQEQDFQKILEKYGTPGPEHKNLEPLVGSWKVTAKFWFKPDAEPTVSDGTAVRKWALGKRYVAELYKGTAAGLPFAGMGWTGYDRVAKKYVAAWIDTMGTGLETSTGTYDPKKKTFTYTSESFDPFSGMKIKTKEVLRIVSNDEHIAEMYRANADGSNEFKVLELRCVRTHGGAKPKAAID